MPRTRSGTASTSKRSGGASSEPKVASAKPTRVSKRRRASSPLHAEEEHISRSEDATDSEYQSEAAFEWGSSIPDEDLRVPSTASELSASSPYGFPEYSLTARASAEVFNFPPADFAPTFGSPPVHRRDSTSPRNLVGPNTFIPPVLRSVDAQFGQSSQRLDSGSPPEVPRSASLSSTSSHSSSGSSDLERLLNMPDDAPVPKRRILPLEETAWSEIQSGPSRYPQQMPTQVEPDREEAKSKAKGKGKAKSKQPMDMKPMFITLPRRDPSRDQLLSPFSLPVASTSMPDNARPMRSTKKDENVTASWRTDTQDDDGPMYTCGWEDCDHEMAGDALAIRRHYETVHWQDGVFLQGTSLMIRCGWPECRFKERGMRWDAYPRHVLTSHFEAVELYKCDICNMKEYKRKDALQRHQRDSCLRCERCGFKFDDMEQLGQHLIDRSQGKECEKKNRKRAKLE